MPFPLLREPVAGLTHLVAALLALGGLCYLWRCARGDRPRLVSVVVFGGSMALLYLASAAYHLIDAPPGMLRLLRKVDHAAIYLLIAGTYTPFTLVTMRGAWGWTIFGIVWGLAVTGIIQELALTIRHRVLSVVIYLVMGWVVVVAIRPLMKVLPAWGMVWLVAGGLFYTIGVVFYVFDKKVRYGHGIFHVFVLAGSISHYIAILWYVA